MKPFLVLLSLIQISLAFAGGGKDKDFYMPDYIQTEAIQIVRDSFGVPHIFAPTDAEVAYGLAWTTMEDDSKTAQFLYFASKGLLGRHEGIQGAIIDYAVELTRVREVAEEYLANCPQDFKRVVEGYCAGANAYFVTHWDELLIKKAFPLEPVDVISGYMLGMSLMAGIDGALKSIVEERMAEHIPDQPDYPIIGSNAIAFNHNITKDGNTYLDINSHQPLEGILSWYEAHLCSEEGLNITGSLFHGGLSIFHGTNENLGWAHTVGAFDKKDIFVLKMKEGSKKYYQYGDEYKQLDKRVAKLRVGLGKNHNLILPVRKKIYWSEFGPTLKTKEGVFALRMASLMEPRVAEQWWRMNKAKNFEEFKSILAMQGIAQMNVCYADKEGNIYLLANGLIPKRKEGLDWEQPVWGTGPDVNWTEYYSIDELAHFENPECGYVFNTNNSAYHGTAPEENLDPANFSENMGYNLEVNNRSARFYELMAQYDSIDWQDFLDIKFDHQYVKDTFYFIKKFPIMDAFDVTAEEQPDLADVIQHFNNWNWRTDSLNLDFSIIAYTLYEIYYRSTDEQEKLFQTDSIARKQFFVDCMRLAKNRMIKTFGTMEIPFGRVHGLRRGDKWVPLNGGPENLRAAAAKFADDGRLTVWVGDSFIQLVKFTKDGPEIYSISPYGASNKPESPHYTDQMEMFSKQQMKKMSLDKNYWLERAEAIYSPK
ncbi:MAG: penicillin acylase family protein [Chitinophagales bacterium]